MGTFSLLTLNCFGAPTPTTRRRLRALAEAIEGDGYDVVCLQEVQTHAYRSLLIEATPSYPAAAHAPHLHAPRGGLLTLARATLEHRQFVLYRDRDISGAPAVMDWLLYKGVMLTRLRCGDLPVSVLNTHLNANYSGDWGRGNRYAEVERRQLLQLAELAAAEPAGALVVVAGDFNIPRGSWLYEEFLAAGGLSDPLAGDRRPTYRPLPGLPARYLHPIDFAFVRAPALPALQISADLRFARPVAAMRGAEIFVSDHLGVELRVSWGR